VKSLPQAELLRSLPPTPPGVAEGCGTSSQTPLQRKRSALGRRTAAHGSVIFRSNWVICASGAPIVSWPSEAMSKALKAPFRMRRPSETDPERHPSDLT
jgi:hypothetical protein